MQVQTLVSKGEWIQTPPDLLHLLTPMKPVKSGLHVVLQMAICVCIRK